MAAFPNYSPQPDTSLHCGTMDTGLLHRAMCLFTSQLSLVLIAPTHEGMARLSWPGWLATYRDGLPVCRRSPIQGLTGPGVDWYDQRRYQPKPKEHGQGQKNKSQIYQEHIGGGICTCGVDSQMSHSYNVIVFFQSLTKYVIRATPTL